MMDFDETNHLVPFDQLHSPPDDDGNCPKMTMGRRATMAVMESPGLFRSPAGLEFLNLSARKRKRKQEEDSLSVKSFDTSTGQSSAGKRLRKSLSRVVSLVNIVSPVKPVKKLGGSLQRTLSFKNVMSPSVNKGSTAPYKKPMATPTKRRPSKLWQETVDGDVTNIFSEMQIRRQNAIFELYHSENDLVKDLHMVQSLYHNSLKNLGMMNDEELAQLFDKIEMLTPLHEDLCQRLTAQKQLDGSIDEVGRVLLDWIPGLLSYVPYCANQIFVKDLLDHKRNDQRVQDFLERCQESGFSRKLDLWTLLDVPRSRLVKYPLMLKNIQNRSPSSHEDIALLEEAVAAVEEILQEVDTKTGEAKCRFYKDRFEYIEEAKRYSTIENSKTMLLDGILRNNRGTKLTAFLFDKAMVLTRPTTRNDRPCYQVYRYPLAMSELLLEDLKDGEVKMGSFRNMLGQGQGSKYVFRITWPNQLGKGYSHTLQALDEHDKKQWLNSINDAIAKAKECKLKEGFDGSPVSAPSTVKISDDESDDFDESLDKESLVSMDDVDPTPKNDMRKRSLVRRPSDCVSPSKRLSEESASPDLSDQRGLTRVHSTYILTTPILADQAIPYADDSSSEDNNSLVSPPATNDAKRTGEENMGTPVIAKNENENESVSAQVCNDMSRMTRRSSALSGETTMATTPTNATSTTPRRRSRRNSTL